MSDIFLGMTRAIATGLGMIEIFAGLLLAVAVFIIGNAAVRTDVVGASFLIGFSALAIILPIALLYTILKSQRAKTAYLGTAGLIAWPLAVASVYTQYA